MQPDESDIPNAMLLQDVEQANQRNLMPYAMEWIHWQRFKS
ncbi:hypothetical protein [Cytobacillus sp. FSL K6-0265]